MANPANKKRVKKASRVAASKGRSLKASKSQNLLGIPPRKSILSDVRFTSPKGKVYHILETNETDAYDKRLRPGRRRRRKRRSI